jgi:hypothetical protein
MSQPARNQTASEKRERADGHLGRCLRTSRTALIAVKHKQRIATVAAPAGNPPSATESPSFHQFNANVTVNAMTASSTGWDQGRLRIVWQ